MSIKLCLASYVLCIMPCIIAASHVVSFVLNQLCIAIHISAYIAMAILVVTWLVFGILKAETTKKH